MDEIQKVLLKKGRKDLAQKYYQIIAAKMDLYSSFWVKSGLPDGVKIDDIYNKKIKALIKEYGLNEKNIKNKYDIMTDKMLKLISDFIDKIVLSVLEKNRQKNNF